VWDGYVIVLGLNCIETNEIFITWQKYLILIFLKNFHPDIATILPRQLRWAVMGSFRIHSISIVGTVAAVGQYNAAPLQKRRSAVDEVQERQ